jgi:NADH dehydrogenase (ubiquinone) 1 alpha subcomplex subunit 2
LEVSHQHECAGTTFCVLPAPRQISRFEVFFGFIQRSYVANNYWDIKNQNPTLPFIVRECEEADPYIIARYQYGIEKKALLANLNEKEIDKVVQDLVEQAKKINTSL